MLRLLRRAEEVLAPWLPAAHIFRKHAPQFKGDLIESAVQLHQAMKTPPDKYLISAPKIKTLPTPFLSEAHGSFQLIDLKTWQKISHRDAETILCVLFPGFARTTAESGKILLVEPTLVTVNSLNTPVSPRRSGTENLHAIRDKSEGMREHAMDRRHSDLESYQSPDGRQKEPKSALGSRSGLA